MEKKGSYIFSLIIVTRPSVIRNPDGTVINLRRWKLTSQSDTVSACFLFGLPLNVHTAKRVARERNNFDNSSDEAFNNLLLARVFSALFTLFAMFIEMICGLSEDGADDDGGDFCHLNVVRSFQQDRSYLTSYFYSIDSFHSSNVTPKSGGSNRTRVIAFQYGIMI